MKYRFDILRRRYQVARRPAWLSLDLHGRSFPGNGVSDGDVGPGAI